MDCYDLGAFPTVRFVKVIIVENFIRHRFIFTSDLVMNKVGFEFQEVGPVFPSHYHAWVTIERTPTKTTYIFEAFYPDLTFEDFDTIYVPDTAYDHETEILAAYEKRMLYIRAQGEIQTLFRIPQDADIREITARWCAERNVLSIRLPRLVQHVCGETVIPIEVD